MPSARTIPIAAEQPAGGGLRPADAEDDAGRHVLRDAPPAVRRGQGQHALLLGRHERHRLDQHAHLGRDRRRREGAGLVPDDRRHERRRQDRRLHAAERDAGSDARHARRGLRLRDHRQSDGRIDLVGERRRARTHRPPRAREQPAADVQDGGVRAAVQPAERHHRLHAARHRRRSQRRASGPACRADRTWRRSTAASARC